MTRWIRLRNHLLPIVVDVMWIWKVLAPLGKFLARICIACINCSYRRGPLRRKPQTTLTLSVRRSSNTWTHWAVMRQSPSTISTWVACRSYRECMTKQSYDYNPLSAGTNSTRWPGMFTVCRLITGERIRVNTGGRSCTADSPRIFIHT